MPSRPVLIPLVTGLALGALLSFLIPPLALITALVIVLAWTFLRYRVGTPPAYAALATGYCTGVVLYGVLVIIGTLIGGSSTGSGQNVG